MIDRDNRVIVPDGGRMKIQGKAEEKPRKAALQVVDFRYGEGRCPVVPLVFKIGEVFLAD